ncbi:hypothetical protein NC661_05420 [Aquibacillus koreensis]|uniref:Uncharacterized protein n=1 Tax=Aquibacillus koreensis TaxID=279446 RepID=A0A9X3WM72_9BACI|nr:hypothetical protein [Aquibacillus koreensis]MCT2534622.1 hypothetical protein [Aquibacillus koreensis]MDC3419806.1 hypothetical protein [Aquibacillus koreensis]
MKQAIILLLSCITLIAILIVGKLHWDGKIEAAGNGAVAGEENDQSSSNAEQERTSPSTDNNQELEVTAAEDAWLLSHGNWEQVEIPDWGPVMQGTFKSTGEPAFGRKASISTNSSFATLIQRNMEGSVSIYVDGELVKTRELRNDGTKSEIEIFTGSEGWHEIELVYSGFAEVTSLIIDAGAEVQKPEAASEKVVVIGHNYGHINPSSKHFVSLLGSELDMEVVNQGIAGTDLNISNPEDQENSGLNRVEDDVIAEDPTAILVVYGQHALPGLTEETITYTDYYMDLIEFLIKIRNELPDVPVFISGAIATPVADDNALNRLNTNLNYARAEVSGTAFIDLAGLWNSNNFNTYVNGEALTEQGHVFLAEKYAEAISEYLDN